MVARKVIFVPFFSVVCKKQFSGNEIDEFPSHLKNQDSRVNEL
jgi:hypothetical protein